MKGKTMTLKTVIKQRNDCLDFKLIADFGSKIYKDGFCIRDFSQIEKGFKNLNELLNLMAESFKVELIKQWQEKQKGSI